MDTRLVETMDWVPVHGATTRLDDNGLLIFRDGARVDYHLLRWTDARAKGARVKLTIVAMPAKSCDTNLYVHHWGIETFVASPRTGLLS